MNAIRRTTRLARGFWRLSCRVALGGVAAALVACGGGGDDAAQDVGGDDPSSTQPDKHSTSIAAIGAAYAKLAQTDPVADAEALLPVVAALPDVSEAGIEAPGNVWFTFRDGIAGMITTVPLVRADDPEIRAAPAAPAAAAKAGVRDAGLTGGVNGGRKAYLFDAVTNDIGRFSGFDRLHPWFTRQGFSVTSSDDNVPPAAYKVRDASVLYMAAHGGVGRVRGKKVFGMSTSLHSNRDDNLTTYNAAINAGEMGYMIVPQPSLGKEPTAKLEMADYLFITPTFVRRYMSFTDGSVVWLNSCSGFSDDAADMREAFRDAGASVVLSWDKPVSVFFARDSALFFFDRLLSANEAENYKADPPNRPFSIREVYDDMVARNRANYPFSYAADGPVVTLARSPNSIYLYDPRFLLSSSNLGVEFVPKYQRLALVPSINGLSVENLADRLTIFGNFGDGPGKAGGGTREVTLGGTALAVQSWNASSIVLKDVPRTGSGSNGELVVKVDGARSNPAWLDQWNDVVVTNYEPASGQGNGSGTATTVVRCTVTLRGSASTFRSQLNGLPVIQSNTDDAVIQDGTCSWDAYGTYNAPTYTLTYAVAGPKALPWATRAQRERAALDALNRYAWVTAYIDSGRLQLQLFSGIRPADGGGISQTRTLNSTGQSIHAVTPLFSTGATAGDSSASFGIDDAILAGQVQQTLNLMTWSGAPPVQAVDPNHAR